MAAKGPQFNLDHEVVYGAVEQLSPMVRRVTAENPGKFTFQGTGTYIIGNGRVAIVDPGPVDTNHVEALLAAVEGETVTHLLITHTHGDHSPAAALLQEHIDAPTWGFGPHPIARPDPDAPIDPERGLGFGFDQEEPEPEQRSSDDGAEDTSPKHDEGYQAADANDWDFSPDEVVTHGQVIDGDGWSVEALHTPGHISNHLCFALREELSMFSGDHVMGWSTTVIPPPDGSLNSYLDSLQLLIGRNETVYHPTHGAPITDPQQLVPALLAHRKARTEQILACLNDGLATIKDIVLRMYTHVPKELYNPAGASVMSHLLALHEIDKVHCSDDEPGPRSLYTLTG